MQEMCRNVEERTSGVKSDDDLAHRVDSIYDTITSSDTETDKKTGTLTGLIAMGMVCLTVIIVTWMIAR